MLRHLLACAIVAASLWSSSSASQVSSSTIPLERFRAPSDVSGLGVTEGAGVVGHLAFQTGLIFNYALNPLVLRGADDSVVSAIVAHRLNADAQFTLGLFEYLSIGVDLPLTLLQLSGDVPADLKRAIGASSGLATIGVGDLRLTPKIRLLREDQHGVSLALIPAFTLPTSGGVRFNDGGASYAYGGDYLGEGAGAFAFIPELAVATNIAGFRPALNLAYRLRQPTVLFNTFEIQPEFVYRLGLGYDVATIFDGLSSLLVFGELFGATADSNPFGLIDGSAASESVRIQNHLEALVGARYALPMGFSVEGGVGTGLRAGYGAPDLRVFAGVRWGIVDDDNDDDGIVDATDLGAAVPEPIDTFEDTDGCPDADNDNDGIPDGSDRCPLVAEDTDTFEDADGCLDPDNDTDGVLDVDDACRDVAGLARYKGCPPPDTDGATFTDDVDVCPTVPGVTEKHGCPNDDKDNDGVEDVGDRCVDHAGPVALKGCPDRDGDTVADLDDACVDVAGVPALAGCKDTDADGIADSIDTCPEEPETINGIDDADGCPDKGKVLVVVTKDKIELKETVFFDSGKDTIQARSFSLLDQLALVMKAHPEVKKVRIEGHTDSDGADDKNLDLSKRRARAVLNALVTRGVEEGRLDSEGFGETKPIANNQTKAGKASNRRVELAIVEQ